MSRRKHNHTGNEWERRRTSGRESTDDANFNSLGFLLRPRMLITLCVRVLFSNSFIPSSLLSLRSYWSTVLNVVIVRVVHALRFAKYGAESCTRFTRWFKVDWDSIVLYLKPTYIKLLLWKASCDDVWAAMTSVPIKWYVVYGYWVNQGYSTRAFRTFREHLSRRRPSLKTELNSNREPFLPRTKLCRWNVMTNSRSNLSASTNMCQTEGIHKKPLTRNKLHTPPPGKQPETFLATPCTAGRCKTAFTRESGGGGGG